MIGNMAYPYPKQVNNYLVLYFFLEFVLDFGKGKVDHSPSLHVYWLNSLKILFGYLSSSLPTIVDLLLYEIVM
jgi:hypothetical protein